jgi:histidinol phosphatase-like enzyme
LIISKNLTEFRLFPDTIAALQKLQAAGYKMIVITNQACVAKGLTTVVAVVGIHHYLKKTLADAGVSLTGIYYCPHHRTTIATAATAPWKCVAGGSRT